MVVFAVYPFAAEMFPKRNSKRLMPATIALHHFTINRCPVTADPEHHSTTFFKTHLPPVARVCALFFFFFFFFMPGAGHTSLFNFLFSGNFVGAILTAGLMFYTTQYTFGSGTVGLVALNTANAKASLAFIPALTLGIMCNALVCLAVWMCFSARTNIDRVVTAVPPIAAFAAAGFEHCIANVYFIPMGLFIKAGAPDSFWKAVGKTASDFPELTWGNFLGNLLPVTIGNIIGGSVMIAAVYWFVYLRKASTQVISD